ncbi:MAG TPA: hypothetical protein VGL73_10830 [Caulobacteraceae bacterium]
MVEVIELGDGQYPPADERCYIVTRDPTGRFYIAEPEVGFVKSEQASFYPVSEQQRRSTIDRATSYADKNGARAVYVVS